MAKRVRAASTRQPTITSAAPGESGTSLLSEESAAAGTGTQPAMPAGGGPTGPAGTGAVEAAAISPPLNSTNTPESDQNGGAGNSAGPADLGEPLGEEAFRARYPLTSAALDGLSVLGGTSLTLRVTAKKPGFRRGGIAHAAEATDYPLQDLHPDQIEAILAEPMLTAEVL